MAKKNEIAKADSASLQPLENIENLIHVIRGKQVMLDRDLARLYGVETFRLNEQVKRNKERFPDDFMFQISKEEWKEISSQFAITYADGKVLRSQIASINEVEQFDRAHDRFLCIDDTVYHIGASLKDLGKKWFAFNRMELTTDELLNKI